MNEEKQEKVKRIIWDEKEVPDVLKRAGLDKESTDTSDALRVVFSELGCQRRWRWVWGGRSSMSLRGTA